MNREMGKGGETEWAGESSREGLANDTVELRIPAKSDYLPVLRAAVGVIAGNVSFAYDEIIQLRVAVSEAFDLAIRHAQGGEGAQGVDSLALRVVVGTDELEILMTDQGAPAGLVESDEETESRAVIESSVDQVEFDVELEDSSFIRMVKRRSTD